MNEKEKEKMFTSVPFTQLFTVFRARQDQWQYFVFELTMFHIAYFTTGFYTYTSATYSHFSLVLIATGFASVFFLSHLKYFLYGFYCHHILRPVWILCAVVLLCLTYLETDIYLMVSALSLLGIAWSTVLYCIEDLCPPEKKIELVLFRRQRHYQARILVDACKERRRQAFPCNSNPFCIFCQSEILRHERRIKFPACDHVFHRSCTIHHMINTLFDEEGCMRPYFKCPVCRCSWWSDVLQKRFKQQQLDQQFDWNVTASEMFWHG